MFYFFKDLLRGTNNLKNSTYLDLAVKFFFNQWFS